MDTQAPNPIHKAVQEHYGSLAKDTPSCCEITSGAQEAENVLYPKELLADLPPDVANFTAGSGDPITLAALQPGETVLDLGSGGGLDSVCSVAAGAIRYGGIPRALPRATPRSPLYSRRASARLDSLDCSAGF